MTGKRLGLYFEVGSLAGKWFQPTMALADLGDKFSHFYAP